MARSNDDSSSGSFRIMTGRPKSRKGWIITALVLVLAVGVCIGLGVVIGYFSRDTDCGDDGDPGPCLGSDVPMKIIEDADPAIFAKINGMINADNIKANLRKYTEYPHLAGTEGEDRLAQELYDTWIRQGLDHVTNVTYDVLLSYPNRSDPNFVILYDENGNEIFRTQRIEKILSQDQNHTDVIPPFNAYSPPGDITADLAYVNYGRVEDFLRLEELGVNVSGCIVIARYGAIFRGDKVDLAAKYGALGVILYSDPADYFANQNESVYPESFWLPGTGVQRGTVFVDDGDPLTPGYPSTDSAYRLEEKDANLPKIPVHPIGYDDAYRFLSILGGDDAPADWQGALNFTYKLGPGFNGNMSVRLYTSTTNSRRNTTNVFGYIRGSVEPDRYVMMGNHRDAWAFGAVDPTSGTAVMMEVSRVLAELVKTGWRPRRTILFCSWGAEEYGLVGSYEWVEGHIKNLADRAVAYLNVDIAVEGPTYFRPVGVPILHDVIYNVTKRISSGNDPSKSLYTEWLEHAREGNETIPRIAPPGSGSDHASIIGVAGVPCIDIRYDYDLPISSYPLYHSVYETFDLVSRITDPEFKYSRAVGQFAGETLRYLADSLLLPLHASTYSTAINGFVRDLEKGYGEIMSNNSVSLDGLKMAVVKLGNAAAAFETRMAQANKKNPLEIRAYNDQLMRLERAFTDPLGLPLRPLHKHLLFAPSFYNSYAGDTFPGLVDLMFGIEKLEGEDSVLQWEAVKRHLATVIFSIDSATSVLKPVIQFN